MRPGGCKLKIKGRAFKWNCRDRVVFAPKYRKKSIL